MKGQDRTTREVYASEFKSLEKNTFSPQPDFIHELRQTSMNRFTELGFPSTRLEEWKNTPVTSIIKTPYHRSVAQPKKFNPRVLTPYIAKETNRVVLLNGQFSHALSSLDKAPAAVDIKSLSEAIHLFPEKLTPILGQIADYHNHAFVALNTAFMDDGVFIRVPENLVMETPIHLVYIVTPLEKNTLFYPRNLICAGPNSQATVIEHYVSLSKELSGAEQDYFTNSVTEFIVEENASIHHIKLQQESMESKHISTTQILQYAHSSVSTVVITLGGKLTRNDVNVRLNGEGCHCHMNGLVLATGQQHVDNHTFINHAEPNCTSRELYKGIHAGRSHGVFNGRIVVRRDAQKTETNQKNKNLLLSKNAIVNSNPQLEINADNVKCTHGSTTGQLDEESIFYLRSRGIDPKTAHFLMINGFASEIIEEIQVEPIRDYLFHLLSDWLSDILNKKTD